LSENAKACRQCGKPVKFNESLRTGFCALCRSQIDDAALELLHVAKTYLEVNDCNCNRVEWPDELCLHDLARAAIKKAEGKDG
jgi:hypothetical protein